MDLKELKLKYNYFIDREKKAEKFFETCSVDGVEKYLPEFHKITNNLSMLMVAYKKLTGNIMNDDQIFNGFKEVR